MLIIGFVLKGMLSYLNNTQKSIFQIQASLILSNGIVHGELRKDGILSLIILSWSLLHKVVLKVMSQLLRLTEKIKQRFNMVSLLLKQQKAKAKDQEIIFVNNIQVTLLEIRWNWKNKAWKTFNMWGNSFNLIVTDWFSWYVSLLETETYKISR